MNHKKIGQAFDNDLPNDTVWAEEERRCKRKKKKETITNLNLLLIIFQLNERKAFID
ncbi:hypothetical protein [Gracilibacillus xinjiangensis]|uniref:Transposase n=1 Tax=Gracilibacillus xinjiangensis TaxID=1193282 RepID=A0ABV8WRZ4_9BACI